MTALFPSCTMQFISKINLFIIRTNYTNTKIYITAKCVGAYGRDSTKIQKLAQSCEPPTAAGVIFLKNASNGLFPFGYYYSILPQEEKKCLNKVMQDHLQLVEAINTDASSIPLVESQLATPPISPVSLPLSPQSYSPQTPGQSGSEQEEQLNIISDSD